MVVIDQSLHEQVQSDSLYQGICIICLFVFLLDYFEDIFETLTTTSKADLKSMAEELKDEVPEPLHTMLAEKESREEAIAKYRQRKEKVTTICPLTCSGMSSKHEN